MPDLNFDFLKGQELALLCFGPYMLCFHFDGGTTLQIEAEFSHTTFADDKNTRKYTFPISASSLTRLLMKKVESVQLKKMES
ncbi:MAG TPA: hypothetical protein VMF86_16440 [Stellaceae bacterium]|nr:hypothetical protein [Stellaceae bacterium]